MYGSSGGYGGGPSPNRYNYRQGVPNSYTSTSNNSGRVAPTKTEDVKDMINNLRVEELKKFLQTANKDWRGKKNELQARALEMVGRGKTLSPELFESLKELHRRRSNDNRRPDHTSSDPWSSYSSTVDSVSGYRKTAGYSSTVTANGTATVPSGVPVYHSSSSTSTSNYRSMPGISSLFSQPSPMSDIPGRSGHQSSSTIGGIKTAGAYDPISYYNSIPASKIPMPSSRPPPIPSVADLKFTPLPFFEEKSMVLAPTTLTPKHDSKSGYHELNTLFTLNTPQANEIASSRKVTPGISGSMGAANAPKVEFNSQLLVRFAMATTGATGNREVTEDCVPLNLNMKVNGKVVQIITRPVDKKNPGVQFKMTRPVEITQLCKISPLSHNQIQLTWQHPTMPSVHGSLPTQVDFSKTFCVSTFMVLRLSSEDLLKKVKSKGIKQREFTASLIRDKLKDADDEIATTSLRAQLVCPLGKMRIRTPGRSTICTHIQCFDVLLFLQMNERKPTWACPVCDKKIPFPSLVVDGLFTEILDSNRSEKCTEVAFLEKPSSSQSYGATTIEWDPIVKEEKGIKQEPKTETSKRVATAPIDLSPQSTSSQAKKTKKNEPEVIDLLSSDEDDGTLGAVGGPVDLRRHSSESDSTIVEGTSEEDEDDESDDDYFEDVFRRSKKGNKNETVNCRLRSGLGAESSRSISASNLTARQPPHPSSPLDDSDNSSDLVILD